MRFGHQSSALEIAAAYFVLAGAWIVFSDSLAVRFFPSAAELARVSQYKGLAFVGVTTILLYFALRRRLAAMERSQRTVGESERRFAAFMDNLPVAAFLRDRRGRYVYVNRYWVEHISGGAPWAGRTPDAIFDSATVASADQDHTRVLAGEALVERILKLPISGQEREFLIRRFPVPVSMASDFLVGSFAVDITEQRKLEDQLRQAAKMEAIGLLAGGIAHDFNNLLTVITGYAQILSQSAPEHAVIARAAAEIGKASERATLLTSQLLVFSRKQIVQPAPLDINAVIESLISVVERLVGENVLIARDLQSPLPLILADRAQIEQVLLNLIVNARDAMSSGGAIGVSTSVVTVPVPHETAPSDLPPGSYILLSVSDQGHGMDESTRARVFEPFFTTKEPGRGTGLGLSTVYGIVQACHGAIYIDSSPGAGSTFRIYLPPAATSPLHAAPPVAEHGGTERILLVEDDSAVRLLTRQLLEHYGYEVVEAPSAARALGVYSASPSRFELVITDVAMPEMDGPELIRRLRSITPGLPVLFFTGYSEELIQRPSDLSGAPVLSKPFSAEALAAAVRGAIRPSPPS